jgi:hypothetical protein
MNDKEMLIAAAKAAGIEVVTPTMLEYGKWNPLEGDGDALRLAVKLRLKVSTPTTDTDCALAGNGDVFSYSEDVEKITITDLYAATRRAIVRAAAEIGKAMP